MISEDRAKVPLQSEASRKSDEALAILARLRAHGSLRPAKSLAGQAAFTFPVRRAESGIERSLPPGDRE